MGPGLGKLPRVDLELALVGRLNMEARDPSGLRVVLYELGPASASCDAAGGLGKTPDSGRDDAYEACSWSSIDGAWRMEC